MLLITEANLDSVTHITEATEDGMKNYYIEGIFMQSEKKNRNGRIYPKNILMNEVSKYSDTYIKNKRAMGELGHPEGPAINLDRVSHVVENLKVEGSDVTGRAKILDTPMGKIVKNLLDEGVKIGVSSRGMGTLKEKDGVKYVNDDFTLAAIDVVSDPSAPDAYVNGIMEGKEWVWDNGILKCQQIESHKKYIEEAASSKERDERKLYAFLSLVSKL